MKTRILGFILFLFAQYTVLGQAAASSNYATQTGSLGTTYSWIDLSAETPLNFAPNSDDGETSFSWPFTFSFYDNTYTTANNISVSTNGFVRLDGTASTNYTTANNYNLSNTSTEFGQIIALAVTDGNTNGGSVKKRVDGVAPNRILTIEYNNLRIPWNSSLNVNVQVSFYETSNEIVLKLGTYTITSNSVDMGIHSGVNGYFNKWQDVVGSTSNTWIKYTRTSPPPSPPAASWNYGIQTGVLGNTYSWIDCSSGSDIVSGDENYAAINWPFNFSFYDNLYNTANSLSVSTNGYIRLDGVASADYSTANNYNLTSSATNLGQIIGMAVYDGKVGDNNGWVRSVVTGTAPERIFTIEYNNLEINYNENRFAEIQVSFYESSNKIVLKLGADNLWWSRNGVDMGLHSGVDSFYNKWQEVRSGTNNTWIEYTPPYIEVNATIGTSIAYYPTLKDAFDKINDGTHQGVLTIKINDSTTETSSAILNASGIGSSNYSSVNIYPTKTGLSISGDIDEPLIDLNGADNVTIDGRVNATGTLKDLSIVNLSTANNNSTSTIRFINEATNNTIHYCNIKGSQTRGNSAIILFRTSNSSSGNSDNLIDNNNITSADAVNRPDNVIYSRGTNGKANSRNTISNNNIYDFLMSSSNSYGINLNRNNLDWIIDGNSFYETTAFSASGARSYTVIKVDDNTINGVEIKNNFIGGSAPLCGGTPWNKESTANNTFNAIYIAAGTTEPTSIQNNTIKNFDWKNSGNAAWSGIDVIDGNVNIGNISGNTIGEITGTGSIKVTGGTNTQAVYGVKIANNGVVNCSNNNIGSISGITLSTNSTNLYGIHLSGNFIGEIKNNTIGSETTASSISASSPSNATNPQSVYGIFSSNNGTTNILENNIYNLYNAASTANTYLPSSVIGIYVDEGTNDINGNIVRNLSISSTFTSAFTSDLMSTSIGIYVNTDNDSQTIRKNEIYNISNEYNSFTGSVVGLFYKSSTGASPSSVNSNFIHSLSVNSPSTDTKIYGIYEDTDNAVFSNNIITFGENGTSQLFGVYNVGSTNKTVDYFFNTIYLSGINSGTNNSYAIRYNTGDTTRGLQNNILFNNRIGTGKHYAIYYNTTGGTFTADYNDYFVSGTGGVLGYYGGDQNTLALLQAATSQDANSLNLDPNFSSPGGTAYLDYIAIGSFPGVTIPSILTDYEDITRSNPPKMGALESSLGFVWQGDTSTDFATASNWLNGVVPTNGADISFAASPARDCILDTNRTLKIITNTSGRKLVLNGHVLTITGSIASPTVNQIDATSGSSGIIFSGTTTQTLSSSVFESSSINSLTNNNSNGLTQSGDITITSALILENGAYTIGTNTLTILGEITTNSGTLVGGSSSNIVIEGSGASTNLPAVSVNNLTLNRTNGVSLSGNVSVNGLLTLTTGTLNVEANSLTIFGNTITRTNGNINSDNVLGSVIFSNSSALILPLSIFTSATIENLTINGTGGLTANENFTVNGILNLQNVNPSATKGLLDITDPYELIMGPNSTNDGGGDVTGIITRNTIIDNHTYTFGNKNTSLSFYPGVTSLPDYMKLKVVIGNDPWGTGTINRVYELIQSNGVNYLATFRAFYLDSELNGNVEDDLSFWAATHPFTNPIDNVKSNSNTTENWVEISDFDLDYLPSTFGVFQISMDESNLSYQTWTGRISSDWTESRNWAEAPFPGTVPGANSFVIIPDAATTPNDPTLPPNAITELKTISLKAGSILNSGASDNAQLSLNHNIGTWNNSGGTFNPGNSTVNFIYAGNATISGTTSFNNLVITENTFVNMTSNSYIKIAGGITINEVGTSTGELRTRGTGETTVEYNGINQTITNPINLGGNSGYSNLILNGSGTKTMPTTNMTIGNDFTIDGTATVTAQAGLDIIGIFDLESTATFISGIFNHVIKGNLDIDGSFTASAGSTFTLNGTASQSILGSVPITFDNLVSNNTVGINLFTDIALNNNLTLTNGTLNVENTTITINGSISKTAGYLGLNTLSSLTFGGTTALTLPATLFASAPSFKNLTINRTGGVIAGSNMTVNGVLNLQSVNPSATIGSFDTAGNILNMGATATTIGLGDVTGKIRRTNILPNIEYTFGHQFSSVIFPDIGTLPSEITLKVAIGTAPTWDSKVFIERIYDISQIGGSGTKALLKARYLDSELNGLIEDNLGYFSYGFPTPTTLLDRNHSQINTTENWITLSNVDFGNLSSNFGVIEHSFGESISDIITWDGSFDTNWYDAANWTPSIAPSAIKHIIIPDATTTPNDPIITASTSSTIKMIDIKSGGILNAGNSSELIIVGSGGAWENYGTFNPGTGKVVFNHGVSSEIVTISGVTDFYDIEVGPNTTFQPVPGNLLRIANVGSADPGGTSIIDFSSTDNTVEWNGTANQTIVDPNGIGGNGGYFNLILSGSGTKTMQNSVIHIAGDFSTQGSVTAIAQNSIEIDNNMTIGTGSSFVSGNYSHELAGDFENNGTFTVTTGSTMLFIGEQAQTILGTSTSSFDNLTVDKTLNNVTISSNIDISNQLLLNGGNLVVGDATLGINGTISNPSGAIEVSAVSNLSFSGTSALTLNNNLFNTAPSLNNLTINNSGGITLGNQNMTVNGTLDLPIGTFTLLDNTLTLAGSSPTRTSGNIDASNSNATIAFTNSSAIVLPISLFSGDITNFTVNGSGGVISNEDISLTGILNLESSNPSATLGSLSMASPTILDMGADATTIGIGDVTGIVRRAHTFSDGIEYSFGNKFTSLNFLNVPGGIKPTWVECKITIGVAPTWSDPANNPTNRFYSFAQSGGTDRMIVKLHYKDNELYDTGTDESQLVFWDAYDPAFVPNIFSHKFPRNKNGNNVNDNWVQLNGPAINYIATSHELDVKQWGLCYSDVTEHTWIGLGSPTYPGDWSLPGHWNGGVPQASDDAIIPTTLPTGNSGYPNRNLLPIISPSEVKSLEIETGATLGATDYDITVYGDTNAWVNYGSFMAGSANVIFDNGDDTNIVTIYGTTNFYDLTVNDRTQIQPAAGSVIGIQNGINNLSGSILDFTTNNNTIDYNGDDQVVINPNGGSTGYYNLNLSGNGLKLLPSSSFNIIGDLSVTNSAIATTESDLTIGGNLNLADTSIFTIGAGKTLNAENGIITNLVGNEGFVLQSTIDGTASLIHNTNNVPATVERYISGDAEDWHFLSSPVSNQTIASASWTPPGTYGNGTGYDLYVWDEPTPCWVYHKNDTGALPYDANNPDWPHVHPQTNFIPGKGYLYSVQATNPTNEFKGNLNNGTISYPITANNTTDPLLKGFNLIGNPYPSSIDWKATGWTRANLLDSGGGYDMWIWNPATNNYGVFNSADNVGTNGITQHIAPMQGFFVRAASNANISMTNNIRVHTGASNWMKPSRNNDFTSNIKVKISSEEGLGSDEVLLQFGHFSNELGAAKLFSTIKTAPSAYLNVGKDELSVRYLTDTIDNPFVPIMFKPGKDGDYSLNIDFEYGSFEYLLLEDKQTKKIHNLLDKPIYKFNGSLKDDFDRFILHFTPKSEVETELSSHIYYNGNEIVVDLTSIKTKTEVKIVDMLGRLILNKTVDGNRIHRFSISKTNQILIVIAKSENKRKISKVVIH